MLSGPPKVFKSLLGAGVALSEVPWQATATSKQKAQVSFPSWDVLATGHQLGAAQDQNPHFVPV